MECEDVLENHASGLFSAESTKGCVAFTQDCALIRADTDETLDIWSEYHETLATWSQYHETLDIPSQHHQTLDIWSQYLETLDIWSSRDSLVSTSPHISDELYFTFIGARFVPKCCENLGIVSGFSSRKFKMEIILLHNLKAEL